MNKELTKLNEKIEEKIKPSEVRQSCILFKNAEFDVLMRLEVEMKELGIYSKNRIIAVASMFLLEELKKTNVKK